MRHSVNELLLLTSLICVAVAVGEPVLTYQPAAGYFIGSRNYSIEYNFTCSASFDPDVTLTEFYWRTNRSDLMEKRVSYGDRGIEIVGTSWANETYKMIAVVIALGPNTRSLLADSDWWCVAEYRVSGDDVIRTVESRRMRIRFENNGAISGAAAMHRNIWRNIALCAVAVVVWM